jgi:hypothetical protein
MEAVLVCDRYSDFLTLYAAGQQTFVRPHRGGHLRGRSRYAAHLRVSPRECIKTDALNSRWNRFCKGAGINEGLSRLDRDAWVVHLDADIWLPPQTRLLLQNANLDPCMIYGIDRFCVKGYAQWDRFSRCLCCSMNAMPTFT